jgi:hypothetical protein
VAKLSASVTVKASETSERSQLSGTKSSPMPSTSQEPAVPSLPVFTFSTSTEPLGSASTIFVVGDTFFMKRPMPVSVPPEPTPQTMASIWCSICRQISGAVPVSCASGLAGLANWLI